MCKSSLTIHEENIGVFYAEKNILRYFPEHSSLLLCHARTALTYNLDGYDRAALLEDYSHWTICLRAHRSS